MQAGTPYEGGHFIIDIRIPPEYPYSPPKVLDGLFLLLRMLFRIMWSSDARIGVGVDAHIVFIVLNFHVRSQCSMYCCQQILTNVYYVADSF